MTSFYDATKITGIIPIPRFFNSGSYRFSDWKAKSLNPHFVVAYISRRFPHAAVTVDTDGEWPRVNLILAVVITGRGRRLAMPPSGCLLLMAGTNPCRSRSVSRR